MFREYRTKYWTFYTEASLVPVIKTAFSADMDAIPSETTIAAISVAAKTSAYFTAQNVAVGRTLSGTGIATGTTVLSSSSISQATTNFAFETSPFTAAFPAYSMLSITSVTSTTISDSVTVAFPAQSGSTQIFISETDFTLNADSKYYPSYPGIASATQITSTGSGNYYTSTLALASAIGSVVEANATVVITLADASTLNGVVAKTTTATDTSILVYGQVPTTAASVSSITISSVTQSSVKSNYVVLDTATTSGINAGTSIPVTQDLYTTVTDSYPSLNAIKEGDTQVTITGNAYVLGATYQINAATGITKTTASGSSTSTTPLYSINLSQSTTADITAGDEIVVEGVPAKTVLPSGATWSIQDAAAITDTTGIFTLNVNTGAYFTPSRSYVNGIVSQIQAAGADAYTFTEKSYQILANGIRLVFNFTTTTPLEMGSPLFEDKSGMTNIVEKKGNQVYINSARFNANASIN